jgi:hypothetical protein
MAAIVIINAATVPMQHYNAGEFARGNKLLESEDVAECEWN